MDRTPNPTVAFEQFAADCLSRDRERITREWVETLSTQLGIRPRRVLPTDELLNHIPEVLGKAAEFLVVPDKRRLTAQRVISEEMQSIARQRLQQGYDAQEIIREFDLLAQLLEDAALRWIDEYGAAPDPKSVGRVFGRLNRVPLLMAEVTVGVYDEEELEGRHTAARRLRDFAETLMHQLRTPLGAAETAAQLLENEEIPIDSEERQRFAEMIRRNLSRARTVVDDVRALAITQLAHAKSGRAAPVGEVLENVLTEIAPAIEERGVRVEVREPIPDLMVDASRVELVLLNLISNAAKYADPAKPTRWVRVGFRRTDPAGDWWVEISDNGLGIPPELQGRIFERFFRAHPEVVEGSGLGLAIVREAIRQLDSHLEVESEPGRGTTFRFPLPRTREAEAES